MDRRDEQKRLNIGATPYAKWTAIQNSVLLEKVAPTGPDGEVKYCDVINVLENLKEKGIRISPIAQKIAEKQKIDLKTIVGSGFHQKIMKKDLAIEKKPNEVDEVSNTMSLGDKRVPLTGMRKIVGERMSQSQSEIPTVTQNMKIDVTELMEARKKYNQNHEARITINDFVLMAVAKGLKNNPSMRVNLEDQEIVYRSKTHLAFAVAIESGLITPVIQDADILGLIEISEKARDLAKRARENKLKPQEYRGHTFTVSNMGMFGIETFTPIINQPDAAILGINAIEDELKLVNGGVNVRKIMRISLTFDHRLLDGVSAVKFQLDIKRLLENPIEMMME